MNRSKSTTGILIGAIIAWGLNANSVLPAATLPTNHSTSATTATSAATPASKTSLQSFKEWKSQKVQEVQVRVDWLKYRLDQKKIEVAQKRSSAKTEAQLSKELGLGGLENQLKSDIYSLEMAKDLTVSDYFAAYLTKQDNKKVAFKEVAGRMSPEEVAELMTAYANAMFSSQSMAVPAQGDDQSEKVK